ncbi:ASST-domain-containing protein [Pseudomassariella vexata]|uniref:ASST-domain-containing protein n=1 Tax=Pseudomassariella vexata TaxID=1141098 RepID=A0A1Y2DPU5_9PEZI|nr:ASST-domain-containing protein [Pseudomassariella vexata]ORY60685.1 ASST-domain-containing protein [Pseudomassariella vexata]
MLRVLLALKLIFSVALVGLPKTCLASNVFNSPVLYDWGFYGLFPRIWYKTYSRGAPLLNFLQWDDQCDDGGFYLLSPRGTIVSKPGPVIVDARGNLVWTDDRFGETTDVKVQTYNGKQYLTFWSSPEGVTHRYGMGTHYMLDETYSVFKTIEPVGEGLRSDLHEFKISDEGTALMTVYFSVPADLSSIGGPVDGWILDSIFQEVDIETGSLLFEWRASEHVSVNETMRVFAGGDLGGSPQSAFDYFHINSVDKDQQGNFVISGRHTHTVMCIRPTGDSIWILGGKDNMFQDLSDGRGTDFTWQHHARMHDNNTLSIFDNAKSETTGDRYVGSYSRGMLIQLDTERMTASLVQEYANDGIIAQSQGSAQVMPDTGNMLVSYGFLPTFTEFSPDGRVLCHARIAPRLVFQAGMVTSYRTFKTTSWVGRPIYPPSIFLRPSEARLYASWHGATEVDRWILQGAEWQGIHDDEWNDLDEQEKDGFEVTFQMTDQMHTYLRVVAVDEDGHALGHTEIVNRDVGNAPSTALHDAFVKIGILLGITIALALYFRPAVARAFRRSSIRALVVAFVAARRRWVWRDCSRGAKAHETQPLYNDP